MAVDKGRDILGPVFSLFSIAPLMVVALLVITIPATLRDETSHHAGRLRWLPLEHARLLGLLIGLGRR